MIGLQRARPALNFAAPEAAPARYGLPRGCHVSITSSVSGFAALADHWRELESSTSAASVFQSFDWLQAWTETYAAARGNAGLCAVTGYHEGRMVFALPLMRARAGPITILRWMAEPLTQYGDALVADDHCPNAWMAEAIAFIARELKIDALRLRHVREDAAVAPYLRQRFRDANMNELAPWLDLSAYADEAAYDARYTSSQRKRRKKIRKALEDELGPVAFELLPPGPARDEAIAQAVAEKCQWLDARGRQNRALCTEQTVAFLTRLSQVTEGRLSLTVSRMTAGGRPISWEIGLRCGGTHFGFITSHVTSLTDYSPGRLHMDQSQRQALKDGIRAFDLMVPDDAHKDSWSSAKVETRDYHLPLTPLGRLYGIGYLETARPLLRKAYYRMPPRVLKLIKPITGH